MKNIIYLPAIVVLLISISSCTKFLDIKSNKSLVVLNSLDDLQALLDDYYTLNSNTPGFGETSCAYYFITEENFNALNDWDRKAYVWQLRNYHFQNDWAFAYRAVYVTNYCLDEIKKIKKTENNKSYWNKVKGEALFFRSFWFLDLIWEYGNAYDDKTAKKDLGIVLRLTSDFNRPSTRATVEECYDRILNDSKKAAPLLPDLPLKATRPSRCAAYALLARCYWSMRIYDSAYKYVNMSLNIKGTLMDFNNKSIVDTASLVPFNPFNKEIIFFTTQSQSYFSKTSNYALIDTSLYDNYNINDLRKYALFRPRNTYHSFKGNYNTEKDFIYFSGLATDELYFLKAECEARLGLLAKAVKSLSVLLKKRWVTGKYNMPDLNSLNKEDVINMILLERKKELLMRGVRWIDVKRLNKAGANIVLKRKVGDEVYVLQPNSNYYALPLPSDIIEITGLKQNPE